MTRSFHLSGSFGARLAEVAGDREPIGRDLHDLVIQRLFAVGMDLQRISRLIQDPAVGDRLELFRLDDA